jgi:hypothetical protein
MILVHMDDCVSTMANVNVIFAWYFVPITCHENIMQVSIFLHITFSSWLNTFTYKFWENVCLQYCKIYYPCHLFQICLNRFSNFHYIICRNNLDNMQKNFELRKIGLSPMVTIRVFSNCIKLILRSLSKSKHIELLRCVHIMHHNSLLCIATKNQDSYDFVIWICFVDL